MSREYVLACVLAFFAFSFSPVARGGEAEWTKHQEAGSKALAARDYDRAYAEYDAARGEAEEMDDARRASFALHMMGTARLQQGRAEVAEETLQRALVSAEGSMGRDHPFLISVLYDLARAYDLQRQPENAEPLIGRALAIAVAKRGDSPELVAQLAVTLGAYAERRRQFAEAEKLYRQGLDRIVYTYGPFHRTAAAIRVTLARLYDEQDRVDEAITLLESSRKALRAADTDSRPILATTLHLLARAYAAQGKWDQAFAAADQLVEVSPPTADPFRVRALLYFDKGEFPKALEEFRRSLERRPTGNDADYGQVWVYLLRARQGEKDAARRDLRQYLDSRKTTTPEDEWYLAVARHCAGQSSEEDLFKAAKSTNRRKAREQECEATFYSAMQRLADGDKAGAAPLLKRAVAADIKDFIEHRAAIAELKRLQAK